MEDSLKLFETIIGNQWFHSTPVIVMFNKTDLLQQKVKKSNVSDYLPGYKGHYFSVSVNSERQADRQHIQSMCNQVCHLIK